MLYRILHDPNTPIEILYYIIPTQYPTRNDHPYHNILPYASTTYYQQSFFQNKRMEQLTPKYYQRRLTTDIFSLP